VLVLVRVLVLVLVYRLRMCGNGIRLVASFSALQPVVQPSSLQASGYSALQAYAAPIPYAGSCCSSFATGIISR
jgi:hypothetical protein